MKIIWTQLWPEIKKHKHVLIFVTLVGAIESGLKGLIPKLISMLVDEAWKPNTPHTEWIWQIPLGIITMWILSSGLRYLAGYRMKMVTEQVTMSLRKSLMNKYLKLNLGFLHSFQSGGGGLISRMISDISIIKDGVQKIADLVSDPFMLIFAFAYLVYLDWKLTIFIAVVLPLVTGVSRRLARSLRKYSHQNQETMEGLAKTLKESLDGSRIVQSFNLEAEMQYRFQTQADDFLASRKKIIMREEAAGPLAESLVAIAMFGILVYIGHQAVGGIMTPGKFTAFLAAITFLQDAAKKVQSGYIKLQTAVSALERFKSIVESGREVSIPTSPRPFPTDFKVIEYRNVSFSYGNDVVLRNISLKINRGEVVALVGASGSGKSTFVNLLERFYDPSSGGIYVDGVNINEMDLQDLRKNISLVSQDVFLFADTIEKNISFGQRTEGALDSKQQDDIKQAARAANAHNFILKSADGYATRVGDHGAGLSGGEKQRVSIARAIYKNAPVLILDEATSSLDTESEQEVQKGLDQLMQGRTTFVIAHRLSTVVRATRILVFKKGEIVEQGSHQDLLQTKNEYFRLYTLQLG